MNGIKIFIFVLLVVLWFLLSGKINLEYFLVGSLIAGILALFYCRMGECQESGAINLRRIILGGKIVIILIWSIIKANIGLASRLWRKEMNLDPIMMEISLPLKSLSTRTFAANAITLTPGTITEQMGDEVLLVHCLDRGIAEDLSEWEIFPLLQKWEEASDA